MDFNPGDYISFLFTTVGPTGAAVAPDTLPTASVIHSSPSAPAVLDSALALTITQVTSGGAPVTGQYIASFTVPNGYAPGDVGHFQPSAPVGGVVYPGNIQTFTVGKTKASVASITTETGETWEQTMKLIRAVLAGNSTVSGSSVSFLRADGQTVALTITANSTTGARLGAATGSLS